MPPVKEVGYFALDRLYDRGQDWYQEHFAAAGEVRAAGEATPNYMFYPWAVERIARDLPGVRTIVCLRNPTDRAYSHYLHWRDRLMLEPRSFGRAIQDELDAGADEVTDHQPDRKPPYFAYLARGRYVEQLDRLVGAFGRERMHIVLLDDMRSDPHASYAGVCRFLGIDADFVPAHLGGSENRYQRYRRDWLLRRLVRARAPRRVPRPAWRWLIRNVFPLVEVPAPAADAAARARVVDFFRPHNAALSGWLGRDLSTWDR